MTDGLLPGADRDLVNILAKRIESICEAVLLNTKVASDRRTPASGVDGHVRGRSCRRAWRRNARSTACWSRSAAGRTRRSPASTRRASRSTSAASSRSTERGATAEPTSSRSATSSASRCWRTRRRTRRASPSMRSPASASSFEPAAIPAVVFTDPEIAWCGLTESERGEAEPARSTVAPLPVGRVRAGDHARPHRRPDQADRRSGDRARPRRRHRRPRRRRADRRRRARDRDGRERRRPAADDPSAPDAVGDGHGSRRSLLRRGDARLQTEEKVELGARGSGFGARKASGSQSLDQEPDAFEPRTPNPEPRLIASCSPAAHSQTPPAASPPSTFPCSCSDGSGGTSRSPCSRRRGRRGRGRRAAAAGRSTPRLASSRHAASNAIRPSATMTRTSRQRGGFSDEMRVARRDLLRQRLVVGRRAAHGGGDVRVGETQPVVGMRATSGCSRSRSRASRASGSRPSRRCHRR